MKSEHLTRQLDLLPIDKLGQPITIIGAGAIGSWTALALAKAGFCNLTVWDNDTISAENMNCQFYPLSKIGSPKVEALKEMIEAFADVSIETHYKRFTGERLKGLVISAVDSMQARRVIWDAAKESGATWYIDGRMGAENALLYTMRPTDPKDITAYEKTLYSDASAMQERCTAKATVYTANLLSGLICKAVKDLVTKAPYPRTAHWAIDAHDLKIWPGSYQ